MAGIFSLAGKNALVTGGGRGIGQAVALGLAEAGANVAVASRTEAEVAETVAQIQAFGRQAAGFSVDLRQRGVPAELVDNAVNALGSLDILVTSSGTIIRKPTLEFSEDEWETVVDLNLKARFFVAKAAAAHMQASGGSIIHIASISTFFGIPNQAAYVTGNGGIGAMTRAQSVDWADVNIRVNAIAPGSILTKQTENLLSNPDVRASRLAKIPLGRIGQPADIAGAAVFLASPAGAYITGHILVVDGGWLAAGGGLKG